MTTKVKSLVYVIRNKNGDVLNKTSSKINAQKLLDFYMNKFPNDTVTMTTSMQ